MTNTQSQETLVGMGQIAAGGPPQIMRAVVGSCIALSLYHSRLKRGAMAHIVLPAASGRDGTPGKFADTAIPKMLEMLKECGGAGHCLDGQALGRVQHVRQFRAAADRRRQYRGRRPGPATGGHPRGGPRRRWKSRTASHLRMRQRGHGGRIGGSAQENPVNIVQVYRHAPAESCGKVRKTSAMLSGGFEKCHADFW